jgi:hopanoid biosynthesis associated protein HpnK
MSARVLIAKPASTLAERALVVTADDFGTDLAVNAAVEIAHRQGVLTAASLMVTGAAVQDAVERARRLPDLRVGLHLALVDARPRLPPGEVPHLVGPGGAFRDNMAAAGATMFFHPAARRELAAEIEAQFAAFAATGLTLDHVNAHKHFHLHPTIAGLILEIGKRHGLRALRVPLEPIAPLNGVEPGAASGADFTAPFAKGLRARARRAGLAVPHQVFGLRWSGAMTTPRLAGLMRAAPAGLTEIYLHPATKDNFAGSAVGYRYRDELAALISTEARAAASGIRLGGFLDFAAN